MRQVDPGCGSPPRLKGPWRRAAAGFVAALVLAGCGSFRDRDTAGGENLEKLYAEAKSDMAGGAWDRAIKALERIDARATGTLLGQQALLDLAYAQWRSTERTTALATVDRFIKMHPSSPAFDYALYLRGVMNFSDGTGLLGRLSGQSVAERDQRASRDAWQSFNQLVTQYPASRYADDARLRMDYIVNALAEHEVSVARYYLRRGAYLAAANRARQAVTEFDRAPAAEEGLAIMAESYDRLGLNELRDAAQRVLRTNFPRSRFLASASSSTSTQARPWWRVW
jgi:outer membrane protein assembly factor BamD